MATTVHSMGAHKMKFLIFFLLTVLIHSTMGWIWSVAFLLTLVIFYITLPFLKMWLVNWHIQCTNAKADDLKARMDPRSKSTGDPWCDYFIHLIVTEGAVQFAKRRDMGYRSWLSWDKDQMQCMRDAEKGNKRAIAMLHEFAVWKLRK